MSTTVEGIVRLYPPMETGTGQNGPWYKQLMVIETYGQYPKKVAISFFGAEKINALQGFPVGSPVKVSVNLESREHNQKWYSDIQGWKVENGAATAQPGAAPAAPAAPAQPQYYVGQIVNGHQLQANGQWTPVQQQPAAPVQQPAAPAPAPQFAASAAPATPAQFVAPQPQPQPQQQAPAQFPQGPQFNAGANPNFFQSGSEEDIPF